MDTNHAVCKLPNIHHDMSGFTACTIYIIYSVQNFMTNMNTLFNSTAVANYTYRHSPAHTTA